MTEDEYLYAQDLTRVRIARDVLREVLSFDVKHIVSELYEIAETAAADEKYELEAVDNQSE